MLDVQKLNTQENIATGAIVLIDNYDSFTYNLYQMLQSQTDILVHVLRNDALSFDALAALQPSRIVLSPGPGHPGIAGDFGICGQIIENAESLACPILGVCLGHQGMVHYYGGQVIPAPEIVHGKTSLIEVIASSPLFEALPNPFEAMRYHSLMIDPDSLPERFVITAQDTIKHLPMAIQHKTLPLYGVQFHPESIGTPQGAQLLKNFLTRC